LKHIKRKASRYRGDKYANLSKPIIAFLLFSLTFIPRVLIAPYTSHGYNVNVFKVWIQRILADGFNFYIQPTQDMLAPDPSWGHDPSFCEYPPIYIYFLWIAGKIYEQLNPQGDNPYLLVLLIKLPMIISESILTVLIFSIVSRKKNLISGVFAAVMYAMEPFCFFCEGVGAYAEGMTALFGIISLYMVMEQHYCMAALFFGLSMMVKPVAFIYFFSLLIFMHRDVKPILIKVLTFAITPMAIISMPFLIIDPWDYVSAMLWGGFHNLGRRMPAGVIWINPSFWCFIRYISSRDIYEAIAPSQALFYAIVTGWLWLQMIKRGLNKEKSNVWFAGFAFVFTMMMFLPAAHEKWIYPAYPLLAISAFLSPSERIKRFSLWAFLVLTITYFQFIFAPIGSVHYHFKSTEILPPLEKRLHAMNAVSRWLYEWLYSTCKILAIFTGQPFEILYVLTNVIVFIKLCSIIRKSKFNAQARLESFQYLPPEKRSNFLWFSSIKEVEGEVDNNLKVLQLSIKNVKEVSLKLEELTKMLKSGEISESIYETLLDELDGVLSSSVEEIFRIRENLELLRARARVEWAKEKIGMEDLLRRGSSAYVLSAYEKSVTGEFHSKLPMSRWQKIIDRIDGALSSLTLEEELSIIEKYLSIVKWGGHPEELKVNEATKQICQQHLNVLSEKWFSIRRDKIKRIMDLEIEASQLRNEVREVEARFMVGEYDRNIYDVRMSQLQGSLRNIEKEISEIRNYINDIDQKIFRITELLKEG